MSPLMIGHQHQPKKLAQRSALMIIIIIIFCFNLTCSTLANSMICNYYQTLVTFQQNKILTFHTSYRSTLILTPILFTISVNFCVAANKLNANEQISCSTMSWLRRIKLLYIYICFLSFEDIFIIKYLFCQSKKGITCKDCI